MEVYSVDKPLTTEERAELKATLLEDRRPAYSPWMVREFGPQAGLFMSQLLFWDGKGHDPDWWIYKTEQEMERETGLSRWQQRKARKVLKGKGVLEEDLRGLPARLHYRANLLALWAVLNDEPLPSATDERPKEPEDPKDEDPWGEDKARVDIECEEDEPTILQNENASEEGNSRLTGEEGNSRLTRKGTNTFPASEEGITSLPSEEGITDPAYTESTSENTTESSHREVNDRDSDLQSGDRPIPAGSPEREAENSRLQWRRESKFAPPLQGENKEGQGPRKSQGATDLDKRHGPDDHHPEHKKAARPRLLREVKTPPPPPPLDPSTKNQIWMQLDGMGLKGIDDPTHTDLTRLADRHLNGDRDVNADSFTTRRVAEKAREMFGTEFPIESYEDWVVRCLVAREKTRKEEEGIA